MAGPAVTGLTRQVRYFSTSVARPFAKLVRPPVQIHGVEGRYATALYSAASKQKKLDQVEKELLRVAQLLKDPKVALALLNPHVKRSIKVKSLNDITAKERFSPLTSNLINLLAENGRLNSTPAVISAFSTIMSVHRGEIPCTVTTASPLDNTSLSELKTVLNSFLRQGQVLKLEVKTDPSIMGGMIVRIGERYVDMSAKSKIEKLKRVMLETV
ncbi:ATP synthase subunit O, mitochondrial isoform X1 [Loxodonta africana]|uniref:ATP synthase peripheral stalk subunit OSCP, mitochondrial n=1 Tax=Loxodonta africana TaxID=9785 RepID=G3TAK8_LOXAF|nr:ATP synthase subunit O, mitochondrial isoform X1 [Loxodonta africana]XP_049714095.1 ATP synthase subunit O, mitochondrial isoform X1 [Elephas maximus indicus]